MARARPRVRLVMILIVSAAYLSNTLARNYAWIFMLAANGVINSTLISLHIIHQPLGLMFNRFGLLVGMVHILLPTTIFVLLATMLPLGQEHVRAAASLAAGPFTAFRRVYFPQTLPGIAAGCLLTFIICLGYFITPTLVGGPTDQMVSNYIALAINQEGNWGKAAALGTILLTATARDPDERYPTIAAMRSALAAYLESIWPGRSWA